MKTKNRLALLPFLIMLLVLVFYLAVESQHYMHKGYLAVDDSGNITNATWTATAIAHEYGGLEADVSAYSGLVKITGGSTSAVTITSAGEAILDDVDAAAQRTTLGLVIDTDVLAYDAGLSNLAGVAMVANQFYYTTADNTHAATGVSAWARGHLDDADEATFKATVNLEAGTDFNAYDAELNAIAGLTSAADKGIQFTGVETAGTFDLTTFGKSIIDDADEATFKATVNLEIGTDVLAQQTIGIANNNLLEVDDTGPPSAGEYVRFTANGLEGRTEAEFKGDFNLEIGTDVLAQQTIGIADNNLLEVDDTDAASTDYARFTASGLQGRDATEVKTDLGLVIGTDVQAYDADLATLADSTAWRIFYSNGTSVITELALGANGTFLKSNGATSAPTWDSAGTGDVTSSANITDNSIVRGDGGAKGVQESGAFIDDNGGLALRTAATDADNSLLIKVAKVVKAHDSDLFDAVDVTDSATVWSQPANTVLLSAKYIVDTQFAAAGMTDLDVTKGLAGDNDGLLAPGTSNLTSDTVGTEYTTRGAYWSATTAGVYHAAASTDWIGYATAVGANLSTTSAGQITFYFAYIDFSGT